MNLRELLTIQFLQCYVQKEANAINETSKSELKNLPNSVSIHFK